MKKKILVAMMAAMTAMLCACGEKAAVESTVNPNDYVTLGDYSNLTADVELQTVSENDIETQLKNELDYYVDTYGLVSYEPVEGRDVIESGDMVNIDYSGTKDGVAFDGGTAQNYYLEIGSGTFIPGFEDGLIGKKLNETVDLDLTFPEEYQNEDLAGQAVVFTVSVNSICDASKQVVPEYDDALIKQLYDLGFSFETMDDYRANVKEYLENEVEEYNESAKSNAIWEAVYATCEVKEPPTEMVDNIKDKIYANAQTYADQYSMTLEDFLDQGMGMTTDEFEEQAQNTAVESAKEQLVIQAIAKKEDIVVSQKTLQDMKEQEAEEAGSTVDEYFQGVEDADYYDYVLNKKVYEYLSTIVTLNEK